MPDLEERLPRIRAAWMAGRSAIEHCPPDWAALIGDGAAAETALAALVAHAAQTLFRPEGPKDLEPRPLLPRLNARSPSPTARSRLRRLLGVKGDEAATRAIVRLVTARGFVMHPADWTPGPRDDWAPGVYAPWLAWAASERVSATPGGLSLETYDDWSWAERRAALETLRRTDPAAAREVISAKAPAEPAERRLALVVLLEDSLAVADAPFLESLAADKSDRVRTLARRLLARLGRGAGDPELARELAATMELAKVGLIKRRQQLRLKSLKTQAQETRRRELFGLVTFSDLARALSAAEDDLLESAPSGEAAVVPWFVGMVAETGSAAARARLLAVILDDAETPIELVIPLGANAAFAERASSLPAVMARDLSPNFAVSLAFAGDALGAAPFAALARAPGWRALGELMAAVSGSDDAARIRANAPLKAGLANLGYLLAPGAAQAVIDHCAAAGLSPADPRLDVLHLNAALIPETSP